MSRNIVALQVAHVEKRCRVASCGNMLHKVGMSLTLCNMTSPNPIPDHVQLHFVILF